MRQIRGQPLLPLEVRTAEVWNRGGYIPSGAEIALVASLVVATLAVRC
jgi:hypothetical protein